ncbi:hypothetical protein QQ045_015239 [Rhodiola kirilowii]
MEFGVLKALLLLMLLFCSTVATLPSHEVDYYSRDTSAIYTYGRFTEVKRHCAPVLPVLAELKPDDTRGHRIKNELWFVNGDWSQEPDAIPLMPFMKDHNDTKLVSFWVKHVDSLRRSDNMVSVSGILEIGFTKNHLFSHESYKWSPDFEMNSETTKLRITFEGVYVESDENGGERHMCLLGSSSMPDSDSIYFDSMGRYASSLAQDDQIMLLLRYPKTFTLTTRGIYGEMKSLAMESDLENFGELSISSQLNDRSSRYQFGSAQVLKACSPYKDSDIFFHGDSVIFQGKAFCNYLQGISAHAEFNINPNHTSFAQDGILGSFFPDKDKSRDLNFEDIKLIIRNFICYPGPHGINTANVAAEFTVSSEHSLFNGPNPRDRSGLSGISIFAEGIWSSSERELCMVGCLGSIGKDSIMCDYQVSLFLPTAFSIRRRSMVYGRITDINAQSESDATISFESEVSSPSQFLRWASFYTAYDYSKISLASAFRSMHQVVSLLSKLQRILFEYPSYNPINQGDLKFLPGDLTVRSAAVTYSPEESEACKCSEEYMACNILSVDLLLGPHHIHISPPAENQDYSQIRTVEIFGYLSITGQCFRNVSVSVEGLYDPRIGSMRLIGCRDLRTLPIQNDASLEQGQDCMVEVEVQYPPINVRWILNQKLRISVSSQRDKQDSLYFSPIVILTQPITYPWQSSQTQFIRIYGNRLAMMMLAVALFCITFQLRYMNSTQGEASSSYISLVMLAIQASSYFISSFINSYSISSPDSSDSNMSVSGDTIPFTQLMLIRACIELSILFRQVRASRTKPNSPSDIKILITTLSIHVLGLSIFLNRSPISLGKLVVPFEHIETYWGLVFDLFLLPQIIANKIWRIRSKQLRKTYYIGFSLTRAFPHLYNYFRDPAYVKTAKEDYGSAVNRLSDIAIAITVMLLALVVYIQQRCCIDDFPFPTETASQTEIMEQQEEDT